MSDSQALDCFVFARKTSDGHEFVLRSECELAGREIFQDPVPYIVRAEQALSVELRFQFQIESLWILNQFDRLIPFVRSRFCQALEKEQRPGTVMDDPASQQPFLEDPAS